MLCWCFRLAQPAARAASQASHQFLAVSSRALSVLDVEASYWKAGRWGVLRSSLTHSQGLSRWNALQDPTGLPDDAPKAHFSRWGLNENYTLPFEAAGQQLSWNTSLTGSSADGMSFKVRASNSGTAVGSTSLMTDTVDAVRTGSDGLNLQLRNAGNTAYTKVKALA